MRYQRIGFTGTRRGMTTNQKVAFSHIIDGMGRELHHGICKGADAEAHVMARIRGYKIIGHPPTNSIMVDEEIRRDCQELRDPDPYLIRNDHIVIETDVLIAAPYEHKEELKSGTWSTIRRARKYKKPHIIIYPSGSVQTVNP